MNIKKIISNKTKNRLKYFFSKFDGPFSKYKNVKKIIVCLGADYGNLGDVAITFAQMDFLKKAFKGYEVIEFPISQTYTKMKNLKSVINKDDIITIVGGGNTSERYNDIELCRQFVIRSFPNNKIISFPQSVELDRSSEKFRKGIKRVYVKHKNFIYLIREKYSFEQVKKYLPELSCYLVPDIVFSYDYNVNKDRDRKGITISFRDDKEKKISQQSKEEIISLIKDKYKKEITFKDTQIRDNIVFDEKNRRALLNDVLEQYSSSEIVITDRLHGMILAYITNTPCIVFSGDNKKIVGNYEWIKDSKRVTFFSEYDKDKVEEQIKKYLTEIYEDNQKVSFDKLEKILKEFSY